MWQALSAVLHLSSLSFHETDNQEGPVAAISDKAVSEKKEKRTKKNNNKVGTCTLFAVVLPASMRKKARGDVI